MERKEKVLAVLASFTFTIVGFFQIDQSENRALAGLSFLTAALFFYQAFGRKILSSCSFSTIKNESKSMVAGDGKAVLNRNQAVKVAFITFLAVVICFGIGFGVGKLLYHVIH
ncbi:hypothetical protein [Flagellimonas meridianipacifica]|uniref:DUF3899 domain-containing protein n=1 Tax=Flagellimonas meridianipacifica TaxID=1080225 RepID=A0A2T0M863_9FLAO|nr:hypothetical protein [Allomuricauda pacifica]PRX53665.1 hypothetical protein CLV81_2052 [Allomuricauda pacifica]